VGAVARGGFPSPDYREGGRFPDRFVAGRDVPPHVSLDFLLAVPIGPGPPGGFPTVVLQHGFGGDNSFVTQNAADFTQAGLAVIGIPAPEHGPRGASFLDFFVFEDFNAFGNNFRQSSVDLLQLVQLLKAGIDLDGDGRSELRDADPGYLGVSLGGVIGGVFAAVEPEIRAAVLNVPGGRLAQFAGGTSSLAVPFLASFAAEAGIPVRTCSGEPTASACGRDGDCDSGVACRFNADFELLLESALPNFQTQLDPGDGISYARGMRIEPDPGDPKAVLIQEGIGDVIVANPLTEALARGIALPVGRPDASVSGTAGLWRFPPPTGHGIFGLPEVRAQAIIFLASGGTFLPAP
jgi:dienelactone hydrolase